MDALARVVGGSLRVDEDALRKGALIVEFDWPLADKTIPLKAIYPDSFPRLRPIVRVRGDPSTFPRRHCSPIDGTLCLLGRDSRQWQHESTLADLLRTQLASALTNTGDEDPQGEPAEYWWNGFGRPPSYCLVDSSWKIGDATSGMLKLRYALDKNDGEPEVQAIVTEIRNSKGDQIEQWSGAIPFGLSREIEIPWIYVDETILPDAKWENLERLIRRFPTAPPHRELDSFLTAQWCAILYRMEIGFQEFGIGWLFLFFHGPKRVFRPAKPGRPQHAPRFMAIPTYRAGEADLGARVPAVHIMREKKIAVVGLGAIGAPLALELARNGCRKLHLLDHDVVEPGNSIRWPLGVRAWGRRKSASLAAFIQEQYPWTEVIEYSHPIGTFDDNLPDAGDTNLFERIMPDVDLVVDATAAYGVSTILSDLCRAHNVPLISLYASPPVEGGTVARFSPNSGCPTCLEFAYHAGIIDRPPGFDGDRGMQQPPGCAERTFTGASFDLEELSLQAVRLVVETLEQIDASESVVQSVSFVTNGRRSPPVWRANRLPKAQECSCAATE